MAQKKLDFGAEAYSPWTMTCTFGLRGKRVYQLNTLANVRSAPERCTLPLLLLGFFTLTFAGGVIGEITRNSKNKCTLCGIFHS